MKRFFCVFTIALLCVLICQLTACSVGVFKQSNDYDDQHITANTEKYNPNKEGIVICSQCDGSGTFCPYCDDEGNCYYCGGIGKDECGHCHGTDLCYSCLGTKTMPSGNRCYTCAGRGSCPGDDCVSGMIDCFYCEGKKSCVECGGNRVCYMCGGDGEYKTGDRNLPDLIEISFVDCGRCDATGNYCSKECLDGYCITCKGEGVQEDSACDGTGECSSCDGSGKTVSGRKCYGCGGNGKCKYCENGLILCNDCRGTRICKSCMGVNECPNCFGTGTALKINTSSFVETYAVTNNAEIIIDDWCSKCANIGYLDCNKCFDGRCIECSGKGEIEKYASAHSTKIVDCSYCQNGKCAKCRGERVIDCPDC